MNYNRNYMRLKTEPEFKKQILQDIRTVQILGDKPNEIEEIRKSAQEVANIYGYTLPKEIKKI